MARRKPQSRGMSGVLLSTLPKGPWERLTKRQRWQYVITVTVLCALVVAGLLVSLQGADGAGGADGTGGGGSSDGAAPSGTSAPRTPRAPSTQPAAGTALELLEALEVKGRAPKTGYDRKAKFGDGWLDPDGNGCDARNDVLQRDLRRIETDHRCRVLTGVLDDPYTGTRVDFVRGEATSTAVQIDHVVALSDAWQKGARALTPEQRMAFANDPLNLVAVDGPTNSSKSDSDAASWLPPERGYWCEYVARQVSVKYSYRLWVTPAEHDAMLDVLETCPAQPAYASDLAALVFME